jgi:AmpD protein
MSTNEHQTKPLSPADYDSATGLVRSARQVISPNYDDRPEGVAIEALIIHAISLPPGKYGGLHVEKFFCNQLGIDEHPYFSEIAGIRVSAHFFISRSGELVQFVPVHKRAWHAGVSHCMGRDAVNDFSIGIELEGCDDDGFEEVQFSTLAKLSGLLIAVIPSLSTEHIYGHEDIAPGRKTDPGPGFNWQEYRLALSNQDYQMAIK